MESKGMTGLEKLVEENIYELKSEDLRAEMMAGVRAYEGEEQETEEAPAKERESAADGIWNLLDAFSGKSRAA
jgi:hypothetical protein